MFRKTLLLLVLSLWSVASFAHTAHHHQRHRHVRHHRTAVPKVGVKPHLSLVHPRRGVYTAQRVQYVPHVAVTARTSEDCIASAIYWESKSEPTEGKAAVGYVVMKRTTNRHFPDTPCGVVYQRGRDRHGAIRCQFDFACLPPQRKNAAQMAEAHRIARQVLAGTIANPVGEALFFQEAGLRSRPSRRRLYRKVIANQAFFSFTPYDQAYLASR